MQIACSILERTKPTIYFSERDQKSTVTVKYNNGVDAEISKTITVTSVAATATAAEARFAGNLKKWYLVDTTSESFNITPEGDAKQVVFYAKDKDGKAGEKKLATVAPHWYIRHGARDRDTGFPIPLNLALKLHNSGCDVNFLFAWNRPHSGDYALDELFTWLSGIM